MFCNKQDPDYPKIDLALGDGIEKVALVLAGVLVTIFGLLPGIATTKAGAKPYRKPLEFLASHCFPDGTG